MVGRMGSLQSARTTRSRTPNSQPHAIFCGPVDWCYNEQSGGNVAKSKGEVQGDVWTDESTYGSRLLGRVHVDTEIRRPRILPFLGDGLI